MTPPDKSKPENEGEIETERNMAYTPVTSTLQAPVTAEASGQYYESIICAPSTHGDIEMTSNTSYVPMTSKGDKTYYESLYI